MQGGMRILVLNGSPRENGTVASLLRHITAGLQGENSLEWIDVCRLRMQNCTGCMACRKKKSCVLPEDDAHLLGRKIAAADALVVGTPVHWGTMSAPLKLLFDRNVPVFIDDSRGLVPVPLQKGKPAVIAAACTAPWPINFLLPQSRGAIRAVKSILHYGGYRILGSVVKPDTEKFPNISPRLQRRAERLGAKLIG